MGTVGCKLRRSSVTDVLAIFLVSTIWLCATDIIVISYIHELIRRRLITWLPFASATRRRNSNWVVVSE